MIEILIALGGLLGGFLIALGVHKKEHDVIREELEDGKKERRRNSRRIDTHDVTFAMLQTSLDYLTKTADRTYDALEAHIAEEIK